MQIPNRLLAAITCSLLFIMPIANAHDDKYGDVYTGGRYDMYGNFGHDTFERGREHDKRYAEMEREARKHRQERARERRKHEREMAREWRQHRHEVEREYNERRREERHRYDDRGHVNDEYLLIILYLLGEL